MGDCKVAVPKGTNPHKPTLSPIGMPAMRSLGLSRGMNPLSMMNPFVSNFKPMMFPKFSNYGRGNAFGSSLKSMRPSLSYNRLLAGLSRSLGPGSLMHGHNISGHVGGHRHNIGGHGHNIGRHIGGHIGGHGHNIGGHIGGHGHNIGHDRPGRGNIKDGKDGYGINRIENSGINENVMNPYSIGGNPHEINDYNPNESYHNLQPREQPQEINFRGRGNGEAQYGPSRFNVGHGSTQGRSGNVNASNLHDSRYQPYKRLF